MKSRLESVEFYINHTCNFGCTGCNRFNNYLFTGYQKWADYADIYKKWSEKLDIKGWVILGGEPTLNKDLVLYIRGIRELWPDSKGMLITNGSFHKRFDTEFYEAVLDTGIVVNIGLHNTQRRDEVLQMLTSWLIHPIEVRRSPDDLNSLPGFRENWSNSYNLIRDESWPDCNSVDDWDDLPNYIQTECTTIHNFSPDILAEDRKNYQIIDANGVNVKIQLENFFYQSALIEKPETKTFTLHNSNRKKAHDVCPSRECHHMMDGKLSKCGQSVLFQEFDKQFQIDLSIEDRKLMMSHQPCSVDDDVDLFVSNIKKSIPQCKFCPEVLIPEEIFSVINKDKFGTQKPSIKL